MKKEVNKWETKKIGKQYHVSTFTWKYHMYQIKRKTRQKKKMGHLLQDPKKNEK